MTVLKTFSTCVLVLVIFVLCQYYLFVAHGPFSTFLNSLKKVTKLSIQEKQARHLHVLLLSYARTGSSFLGDLLQSYPKSFYQFEPLHFLDSSVISSGFPEARQLLSKLFQCQVSQLPGFLNFQEKYKTRYMKLQRSLKYWKTCSTSNSCYNSTYMDEYCSNHSVVIIKTIRLGLREAAKLFTDYQELNLKIIYLVRDPRGVLNSRMKRVVKYWCKKDPLCYYSKPFCQMLEDDFDVICSLMARSEDFMLLRYEDLATDPFGVTKQIANFLGFNEVSQMNLFLKSHTATTVSPKKIVDGVGYFYNTFRNSMTTASKWRQELPFVKVARIQKDCKRVLDDFGYHFYSTSGAMKSNVRLDKDLLKTIEDFCPE